LQDGRSIRLFNVNDYFYRDALWINVDFSLPSEQVIRSLDQIIAWRGKPAVIRADNGPDERQIDGMGSQATDPHTTYPARQTTIKCLCGTVESYRQIRMVIAALLGKH